jgi:hypothetical protein
MVLLMIHDHRSVPVQFIGTPECLADITGPSSAAFDINTCQGLLTMLDALALGNTNPPVTCELSCVKQFALVGCTAA